jgi:hypothetical protein
MEILRPIDEDEMIATFLRAEVDSARYGPKLEALLARDGRDEDILRRPDIADAAANDYRRGLLEWHRCYDSRDGLFAGFPCRIDWCRAGLTRDEVLEIHFIDWDWWRTLSGGSGRPRDAARRIRAGEVAGVGEDGHEPVAAALRLGGQPELIAVTTSACTRLVLVEGHYRLTAYALFPDYVPEMLEIVLGVSDEVEGWWAY